MEMHISQSLIMRIREFGESDLLVSFFTSDRGRVKGVARGARRSKKRFANCLDLFCLADVEYGLNIRNDLYSLSSCKLVQGFPGLRSDFYSLSLASYMVELTEALFPQNVVDGNMFELLKVSFKALDEGAGNDSLRIMFETKAMSLGGYGINLERCCKCGRSYTGTGRAIFLRQWGAIACLNCETETGFCPGMEPDAVKVLKTLQSGPCNNFEDVPMTQEGIREIGNVLKLHMEYRLGRRLKSAKYLE